MLCVATSAFAAAAGPEDARHLLTRTGFSASEAQVRDYAGLERQAMVERLFAATPVDAVATLAPPEAVDRWVARGEVRTLSVEDRRQFVREQARNGQALKAWWLQQMLTTESPLSERMTLFWHNHFTSSLQKVKSPALLYRQNALLRRHATGNFATLLHAAVKDPAMLVYLDNATSRRGQPNENLARELMELFTLGEGRYSEQDVREAARAFTGWSIDPESGKFLWRPFAHDDGEKTVFGQRGAFKGEDVVALLLARPESARFIVAKLWKEFVSPEVDAAEVQRIAQVFRSSGWEIRAVLRELLLSEAFWAAQNRTVLVKSPAELVVGTLRQLEVRNPDLPSLAQLMRRLGQDLFSPPNVRGWPGGEAWINSSTLLARKQFLERIANDGRMGAGMMAGGADALRTALLDPAYQLK